MSDRWHCHRCGSELAHPAPVTCTACGYALFVNPRPTGTAIILEGDRFLMVRRSREPQAGLWDLPGGFCDGWEHPRDAAVREVREELGVEVDLGDFVGMYLGTYVYQDERLPVLDCFWLATLRPGTAEIVLDTSEASEYAWAELDAPPQLAFETMDAALRDAKIRRMSVRLGR